MEGDRSKLKLDLFPPEIRPDCWNDNERMNALFAPFRKREVNVQDWDSKLTFWKTTINKWCHYNSVVKFTVQDLEKVFRKDEIAPACLATVVEEMQRSSQIKKLSDYMKYSSDDTWSAWAVDLLVKRPLMWTLDRVKERLVSADKSTEEYVEISVVKELSEYVLSVAEKQVVHDVTDRVLEIQQLYELCSDKIRNIEDLQIVVLWLRKEKHITVGEFGSSTIVKIAPKNTKASSVTSVDYGVHQLKNNEQKLDLILQQLEEEKGHVLEEARNHVRNGSRNRAKICLRKKKNLETCIEKRSAALDHVQQLLYRIKEADSDSKVLECYKYGVQAMKKTFSDAGLSQENVASTMDEVEEVLEVHDDLQAILSQPVGTDYDVEDELNQLLLSNVPKPSSASPQTPASPVVAIGHVEAAGLAQDLEGLTIENLPSPPSASLSDGCDRKKQLASEYAL